MMYALIGPSGKIHEKTVGWDRHECEGNAFSYMANRLGRNWSDRFWKNWNGAQADLRRRGYTIRKVKMVLA